MAHKAIMEEMVKKGIQPNKNMTKLLKKDMELDKKECKAKSKALEKMKK